MPLTRIAGLELGGVLLSKVQLNGATQFKAESM